MISWKLKILMDKKLTRLLERPTKYFGESSEHGHVQQHSDQKLWCLDMAWTRFDFWNDQKIRFKLNVQNQKSIKLTHFLWKCRRQRRLPIPMIKTAAWIRTLSQSRINGKIERYNDENLFSYAFFIFFANKLFTIYVHFGPWWEQFVCVVCALNL